MKGSDRRSPVGQVGLPWVSKVLPAEGDCLSVWSSPPARGDKGQSQPVLAGGPAHMGTVLRSYGPKSCWTMLVPMGWAVAQGHGEQ